MKRCTKCKQELDKSNFHKNKAKKDGLSNVCKPCNIFVVKEYIKNHPEKYKNRNFIYNRDRERRSKLKERIKQIQIDLGGCQVCGEKEICCLDFHHKNREEKSFEISQFRAKVWEEVLEEIKKCILVCSNCHRKIHAGIISV